ncbi:DEAD/DEAH box helicase [Pontibacter rugosus]
MSILLQWLATAERDDTKVLWLTHRRQLKRQAWRELQRALNEKQSKLPSSAVSLLEKRVEFVMLNDLSRALEENEGKIELVVVDEAHHAAANSYQPLFNVMQLRGLFLTATPNRMDELPIGIDEVAYSTTYRELFKRGVIVEPTFLDPIQAPDWLEARDLHNLANLAIERTEIDFRKLLISVSKKEHAEKLYQVLSTMLDGTDEHPLSSDNIVYVHGSGSSTGIDAEEALDEFSAFPRGILIATGQLIGEGFDDPSIDSIIVTYASSSMSHLMQLVGRVIRFDPHKTSAYVIQARASELDYYFEQGWLYQDISDSLRPRLKDFTYSSIEDLKDKIDMLLRNSNVQEETRVRIMKESMDISAGERYHLLLTGRPYYGNKSDFETNSTWEAILVKPNTKVTFHNIFNSYSDIGVKLESFDQLSFLMRLAEVDSTKGSNWKSYMDMLHAMRNAYLETRGLSYSGEGYRGYEEFPQPGTTWLTYCTFTYRADVPEDFDTFLSDTVNKDEITSLFLSDRDKWKSAIKVLLPLAGTYAFLLEENQVNWLDEQRALLAQILSNTKPKDSFAAVEQWRLGLMSIPLPYMAITNLGYFINEIRFKEYSYSF